MTGIPIQDQRYADTGRRTVAVGGRRVGASCTPLKPEDAARFNATHQIVLPAVKGPRAGSVVDFDGTPYRVVHVTDPRASEPAMRGRYLRLICVPEHPTEPDPAG
jgi:hypothetical protein